MSNEKMSYNGFSIGIKCCPFCGGTVFKELTRKSSYDPYEATCDNCGACYSRDIMEMGMESKPVHKFYFPESELALVNMLMRKTEHNAKMAPEQHPVMKEI